MQMNVAFDIGNVLVDFSLDKFYEEAQSFANKFGYNNSIQCLIKSLNEKEWLNYIGQTELKESFSIPYGEHNAKVFLDIWNSQVKVNDSMVSFIKNLKNMGCKIAYLSNMGYEHFNYLKDSELFKLADELHISCEVGIAKPKKLFFQSFLMDNENFRGAFYFDDKLENVEMAKRVGFKAEVFDLSFFNKKQLKTKLKELEEVIYNAGYQNI